MFRGTTSGTMGVLLGNPQRGGQVKHDGKVGAETPKAYKFQGVDSFSILNQPSFFSPKPMAVFGPGFLERFPYIRMPGFRKELDATLRKLVRKK